MSKIILLSLHNHMIIHMLYICMYGEIESDEARSRLIELKPALKFSLSKSFFLAVHLIWWKPPAPRSLHSRLQEMFI